MTVYKYKRGSKLPVGSCSVAIGFFDGVHLAHRELISTAIAEAKRRGIPSGILTFASESSIKSGSPRLYTTEERLALLDTLGLDFAALCDFSDVSGLSGEKFVRDVLVGDISAVSVTAGFNFRFGKGAASGAEDLCRYMSATGGEAIIKKPYLHGGEPLSSSLIRGMLASGEVAAACVALGAPYFISGKVSHGNRVGRELGFPTLNIAETEGRVKLKQGVYRSAALVSGRLYHAVTNVGVCPTFDEREYHVEAHLIDFSGDLYGEDVRIYFLGFLREERRFDSPEELKTQINVDKNRTIKENGELLWQEFGLS